MKSLRPEVMGGPRHDWLVNSPPTLASVLILFDVGHNHGPPSILRLYNYQFRTLLVIPGIGETQFIHYMSISVRHIWLR